MTYEEAKRNLIGLLGYLEMIGALDSPTYESLNIGIDVIEKAEKYRWHDLRKNPNDLPNDYRTVLVFTDYYAYETDFYPLADGVVAWREIETFEEEE